GVRPQPRPRHGLARRGGAAAAGGAGLPRHGPGPRRLAARAQGPARAVGAEGELRHRVRRRARRPVRRRTGGLGAGALPLPRPAPARRAGRSAVRAADRGRRHRPDRDLRAHRPDRPVPGAARHPGGLPARRHRDRAGVAPPGVRRAPAAAGPRGPAPRPRAGRPLRHEQAQAAASLGASRLTTLRRVVLPELLPALLTGFSLPFARALGEYGSVIFIAGNKPFQTEIAPLLITIRLEEYDYNGAIA